MALRTPAFNDAKTYDFAYLRHLAETLLNSEGVANYGTDFLVTAAATLLKVDVAAGAAWVKGDSGTPGMGLSQGLYSVVNDAAIANAVTLAAADATNPRLDQIVLKVTDTQDLATGSDVATLEALTGTPTGGATLANRTGAAALGNDRLLLADVLVPATAVNLTAANVRDRRIPANGRATRYIATVETTTTAYAELTTPDAVDVYVPANARVELTYQALVKRLTADGKAGLFITDLATMTTTQAKIGVTNGVPIVVEASIASPGSYIHLFTMGGTVTQGLLLGAGANASDSSDVTTGQVLGGAGGAGGAIQIVGLPAGNYRFGIRYQGTGGTTTAKERRLSVAVMGNGRSA